MTTNRRYLPYLLAATLLITIPSCNNSKTSAMYTQKVVNAEIHLISESPDIAAKLNELKNSDHVSINIANGSLNGDTLGQTTISQDGSATILIDLFQVSQHHDRLEPVIGHEIYHVWEAYHVYGGADKFIALANSESSEPWYDRTVEKSAIAREDALRIYLKTNYPKEYSGMSTSRELQNSR